MAESNQSEPSTMTHLGWKEYFSTTGSYSREELAKVLSILLTVVGVLAAIRDAYPQALSEASFNGLFYCLYPIWGIALGKRSRDLGTTFTYGMLIGMVFPFIGIVFLFQEGEKFRLSQARRAEIAAQATGDKRLPNRAPSETT